MPVQFPTHCSPILSGNEALGPPSVASVPLGCAARFETLAMAEIEIIVPGLGEMPIPKSEEAVQFTARIFEKEGDAWPRAFAGVRVYLEGFRIPPYGDSNDDWLDLDTDYRSRGKGEQGRLRRFSNWQPPEGDEGEGLVIKGNRHYFGAVFLTR